MTTTQKAVLALLEFCIVDEEETTNVSGVTVHKYHLGRWESDDNFGIINTFCDKESAYKALNQIQKDIDILKHIWAVNVECYNPENIP